MSKISRALGDGASGDVDNPDGSSTFHPGLLSAPEKAGSTPEEQAAAELKAHEKESTHG